MYTFTSHHCQTNYTKQKKSEIKGNLNDILEFKPHSSNSYFLKHSGDIFQIIPSNF